MPLKIRRKKNVLLLSHSNPFAPARHNTSTAKFARTKEPGVLSERLGNNKDDICIYTFGWWWRVPTANATQNTLCERTNPIPHGRITHLLYIFLGLITCAELVKIRSRAAIFGKQQIWRDIPFVCENDLVLAKEVDGGLGIFTADASPSLWLRSWKSLPRSGSHSGKRLLRAFGNAFPAMRWRGLLLFMKYARN